MRVAERPGSQARRVRGEIAAFVCENFHRSLQEGVWMTRAAIQEYQAKNIQPSSNQNATFARRKLTRINRRCVRTSAPSLTAPVGSEERAGVCDEDRHERRRDKSDRGKYHGCERGDCECSGPNRDGCERDMSPILPRLLRLLHARRKKQSLMHACHAPVIEDANGHETVAAQPTTIVLDRQFVHEVTLIIHKIASDSERSLSHEDNLESDGTKLDFIRFGAGGLMRCNKIARSLSRGGTILLSIDRRRKEDYGSEQAKLLSYELCQGAAACQIEDRWAATAA